MSKTNMALFILNAIKLEARCKVIDKEGVVLDNVVLVVVNVDVDVFIESVVLVDV